MSHNLDIQQESPELESTPVERNVGDTRRSTRQKIMNVCVQVLDRTGDAVSVGAELAGIGAGALIKTTGKATVAAARGIFNGIRGVKTENVSQAI